MRGLNFGPLWQRGTALFVAMWHQKAHRLRLKLNNGSLTNENEETDTEFHQIILRLVVINFFIWRGDDLVIRGLAHVPDRSAHVPSSARVPGLPTPALGLLWHASFSITPDIFLQTNSSSSSPVVAQQKIRTMPCINACAIPDSLRWFGKSCFSVEYTYSIF